MNKIQKQRCFFLTVFILGLAISATFIFLALKQNMNVFLAPSEISDYRKHNATLIRLGGVVKNHSLQYAKNDLTVTFIVTDFKKEVLVTYHGILPDLFRENKGVIASGHLAADGTFTAIQVLAKHDENYMPKHLPNNTV